MCIIIKHWANTNQNYEILQSVSWLQTKTTITNPHKKTKFERYREKLQRECTLGGNMKYCNQCGK